MKDIGIVVCNYNKKDDVLNCVRSILDSNLSDISYDVVVVDNGSADGSADALEGFFSNQITILRNQENLGGSGGFCTGLRHVMKSDYEYIMCVDNDVLFDKDAIRNLRAFMEEHHEVGMAGAKILIMDDPKRLQMFGCMIDYENYKVRDIHEHELDSSELPEYLYCDYVPACALIARKKAVEEVGLMPEENYIYWDDMEWGVRFNLAGYKVACVGQAKVWHRGGAKNPVTTFPKYYFMRNRILFFLKYLPAEKIECFAKKILDEAYRSIIASRLKGDYGMAETIVYAVDDAIHGAVGKAAAYKILPRKKDERLKNILKDRDKIDICYDGDLAALGFILMNLKGATEGKQIRLLVEEKDTDQIEELSRNYPQHKVEVHGIQGKDAFIMCSHIFDVKDEERKGIYVDRWMNLLVDDEEYAVAKNFKINSKLYVEMNLPLLMHALEEK